MAKRRMLSIDFCESDSFYCLSPTTRMLYVHFILNADDDGFVDKWRTIMRCARIESKHYIALRNNGYVIELNERLIVITDWHRHNTIRADRYVSTAYTKELQGLCLDENKRYFKTSEDVLVNQCVPQSRLDKIRIDKSSIEKKIIEEEKNKSITTNQSFIHTEAALQQKPTDTSYIDSLSESERLMRQGYINVIALYFMKEYQRTDISEFIKYCDDLRWIREDGRPIIENYKLFIDNWMNKK